MMRKNILCMAAGLVVLVALSPTVRADIDPEVPIFHIEVCDPVSHACVGVLPIAYSESYWNGGVFHWELSEDTYIEDILGNPTEIWLQAANEENNFRGTSVTVIPAGPGRANPQVNVNFSVIGGLSAGDFTITSALVSFPTIYNAQGQVNVGINLTDRTPANATLTNMAGFGGKSYSWVNGLPNAGGASLFRQLFAQNLSITGGSISDTDQTAGFEAIGANVSSISGQIKFTLSARDLASGSSTFIVTPEPASALMVLGLVALLRRR